MSSPKCLNHILADLLKLTKSPEQIAQEDADERMAKSLQDDEIIMADVEDELAGPMDDNTFGDPFADDPIEVVDSAPQALASIADRNNHYILLSSSNSDFSDDDFHPSQASTTSMASSKFRYSPPDLLIEMSNYKNPRCKAGTCSHRDNCKNRQPVVHDPSLKKHDRKRTSDIFNHQKNPDPTYVHRDSKSRSIWSCMHCKYCSLISGGTKGPRDHLFRAHGIVSNTQRKEKALKVLGKIEEAMERARLTGGK
jgi:hypothetical protein